MRFDGTLLALLQSVVHTTAKAIFQDYKPKRSILLSKISDGLPLNANKIEAYLDLKPEAK